MICQAMIPTGQQAKFVNHRSAEGETALHTALTTNNVQVANLLLHCGADPFQQNAYHESSFYLACYSGYLDFVKIILRTRYENYLMHNRAYVHIFHLNFHAHVRQCTIPLAHSSIHTKTNWVQSFLNVHTGRKKKSYLKRTTTA